LLLRPGGSQARNKLIAKAFKEAGIIERYGSGIRRILSICNDYGIVPPRIEEVFNGFRVVLFKEKMMKNKNGGVSGGVSGEVSGGVNEIYLYIKNNPGFNTAQIKEKLNIPQRTLERIVKELKDSNKIVFKGSFKTGGYFVK
jgi:ATP-dependent DNA helicase RecG